MSQSEVFQRKLIERVSKSAEVSVYLILTPKFGQDRVQQVIKDLHWIRNNINVLMKGAHVTGVDIEKYQNISEHGISKVDFSIGGVIYVIPSNLKLNVGAIIF